MKILEDSITVDGHVLHRIQADRNISCQDVETWVVGLKNLTIYKMMHGLLIWWYCKS